MITSLLISSPSFLSAIVKFVTSSSAPALSSTAAAFLLRTRSALLLLLLLMLFLLLLRGLRRWFEFAFLRFSFLFLLRILPWWNVNQERRRDFVRSFLLQLCLASFLLGCFRHSRRGSKRRCVWFQLLCRRFGSGDSSSGRRRRCCGWFFHRLAFRHRHALLGLHGRFLLFKQLCFRLRHDFFQFFLTFLRIRCV